MNKGKQVKNLKFWVNIPFQWPQSRFAATKIYILFFNLTHSLFSLMGSFHFSQWKKSFSIHWEILKILGNAISQSFMLSLKCDHPLLCELPILFSTVKLKLGHTFSQPIHKYNISVLNVGLGLSIFPSFFQFTKKRWKIGIFEKPWLHLQIFLNSLKSLKIEILVHLSSYLVKRWGLSFSTMTCGVRGVNVWLRDCQQITFLSHVTDFAR